MTGQAYHATVAWTRDGADFARGKYSRAHVWRFDEGLEVPASASPSHVPPGTARADAVDPEEAFVAALSSCHMLFFLHFAGKAGFEVDSYRDAAVGVMGRNAAGRHFVERVTLDPQVAFSGERTPSAAEIAELHHRSHEACYLANSVVTEVIVTGHG
jgi:organic hydroperoxide reductase OsmC/OhrA